MPKSPSPFDLNNDPEYAAWRERKLVNHPTSIDELVVEIDNPQQLRSAERDEILARIRKCNMAIYASAAEDTTDREQIRKLGLTFGLERLDHNPGADDDAITSLKVQSGAQHTGYIPYTNRPIAWHTDGYYNRLDRQIYGLLLHCVQPAAKGGANQLLDHEIVYLQLRDSNPDYVRALMHPHAMTIPPNVVDGRELRPARTGPVFMLVTDGKLHMRYTDRSRSIEWRDDPTTRKAVAKLKELLHGTSPYQFEATLQPGQGLISNNILHTRSGFEDGSTPRTLYRARYYDRIQGS